MAHLQPRGGCNAVADEVTTPGVYRYRLPSELPERPYHRTAATQLGWASQPAPATGGNALQPCGGRNAVADETPTHGVYRDSPPQRPDTDGPYHGTAATQLGAASRPASATRGQPCTGKRLDLVYPPGTTRTAVENWISRKIEYTLQSVWLSPERPLAVLKFTCPEDALRAIIECPCEDGWELRFRERLPYQRGATPGAKAKRRPRPY